MGEFGAKGCMKAQYNGRRLFADATTVGTSYMIPIVYRDVVNK